MAKRDRRDHLFRRILVPVLAVLLPSAAPARPLDPREPHAAFDDGFSLAAQPSPGARSGFDLANRVWPPMGGFRAAPGWRDPAPLRLPLPLPERSPASRLRWEITSAAPAPAPPAVSGFTGWLPSILLAGAFAATQFALEPPEDSRWTDRNSFDSGIRRSLRGGSRDTRKAASVASHVLFSGMGAALVADWWWLREEYGFLRSVQVDSRWILADNVATRVAKVSAGRQRPYVQPCGRDRNYVPACGDGRDGNASFFSGLASNAATLAGLLCARHLHRRDSDASDAFVCGGAATVALTTGVLRIVSEDHFATDVIAGWAAGVFFGYYLPTRFDYPGEPDGAFALRSLTPVVGRDFFGLQYGFRF
jgi:membrane-associated phospholipid phosphatase